VDKTKSPILILIVLIIVSLALAGGLFHLLQKEHATNATLQKELDELKTKQGVLEKSLDDSKKILVESDKKLKEARLRIDALNSELEVEKSGKEEALKQAEQLKGDLAKQNELRAGLETKLIQTRENMRDLEKQLGELTNKKEDLEKKIQDLEAAAQQPQPQNKGIDLGTVVVGPEQAKAPAAVEGAANVEPVQKKARNSAQEGKVLVINKDYNFVVINLGSKDGVNIDDVFSVYRGNKYIGDVKVEKIHDSMSAAELLSSDIKNKIKEGDSVLEKTR